MVFFNYARFICNYIIFISVKKVLTVIFCLTLGVVKAQLVLTSASTISTCSSNGSITVHASGGTSPYLYQIIASTTGIVRPAQNVATFQNLPPGNYSIRVTDFNNLTGLISVTVNGTYAPLRFTSTQSMSTITLQAVNGKAPYQYTYSIDGGNTFLPYSDNPVFPCFDPGAYPFRIKDSCDNIYTEVIVVNPNPIRAFFRCSAAGSTRNITLTSISGGNGGFVYTLLATGFSLSNATGNFTISNPCLQDMKVRIRDSCGLTTEVTVCGTNPFNFNLVCVNFSAASITIGNVTGGNGQSFQYIANDVISNSPTVTGFPITNDTIIYGIIDSCGKKTLKTITRMQFYYADTLTCEKGLIHIGASYLNDLNQEFNFYPVHYYSVAGPTPIDITMQNDSTVVTMQHLLSGNYTIVAKNACGDSAILNFNLADKCYRNMYVRRAQNCGQVKYYVYKDCDIDTNVVFTLYDLNNHQVATSFSGLLSIHPDSCYKISIKDTLCDTVIYDYINPISLRLVYATKNCTKLIIGVQFDSSRVCMNSYTPTSILGATYVAQLDASYHVLSDSGIHFNDSIQPGLAYLLAYYPNCGTDTVPYIPESGFADTVHMCVRPTVKVVNNKCRFAWQVELLNNPPNKFYTITGNNTNLTSSSFFLGLDTGRYLLTEGCNYQPLYLPDLYHYQLDAIGSCPGNSVVKAFGYYDTARINAIAADNYYSLCNVSPMDYTIQEVGNPSSAQYSPSGLFSNLKNGTYYAVFYKGNAQCNFFSDTIFTPFYTRPSLSATYGLICNGNNATIKVSVTDGRPPYTYEVMHSSIPPITTDSTSVFYTTLPLGTSQFKVTDACGISMDFATEVLSVDFVPTYKKQCDGRVELIAPDIFNTSYVWTNNLGDTLGTQPVIYTIPNGADTFHLSIHHFNCDLDKTIYVEDFSASVVTANAGQDKIVDTAFTFLEGNAITSNAMGTWTQINPSSGISMFDNVHLHNTGVHVDVFPGRYTYVWTVIDTANGCVVMDTVEINYLKCPGITDIIYSKTKSNAICGNNGEINIQIIQSSLPVSYLWNTGDTAHQLSGLDSGMYIVKIYDRSSCTEDIYDTTFIKASHKSYATIHPFICIGDTLKLNQHSYYANGTYYDTLVNSLGCDSILTIQLTTYPVYHVYDSVSICHGDNYTLPNGQIISQAGNYQISYTSLNGCDSIYHYYLSLKPLSSTNIDTSLCYDAYYILPNGDTILQAGKYVDTLQNSIGCDSIIQFQISFLPKLNKPQLGEDTIICMDDAWTIALTYPAYVHYVWQDGSHLANYTATKKGIYWLQVTDGCTIERDTLKLGLKSCDCHFYIPEAFSPNHDGFNDLFGPIEKCEFYSDYTFEIFNRWGELLFSSPNPQIMWDGLFKNSPQPLDEYIWTLKYTETRTGEKIFTKGTITLLR